MVLNDYFGENMSVANGIAFTGGAFGMIVFAPFVEYLISMFGWRGAVLILGAVCFNICVTGALMRPPRRGSAYKSLTQTDAKCRDRDTSENAARFQKTLMSYFGFDALAKEPILVLYLTAFCLWSIATAGWIIFLVSYTITLGYSPQVASFFSSIGGVGTLIGRLLTGPITDIGMLSGRAMFCVLSIGSSATLILYPFVESYWALAIVSFLVGFFVGTPTPVVILMLKELFPNDNEAFTGAVGLHYFALGVGLLTGGPLTGKLCARCHIYL